MSVIANNRFLQRTNPTMLAAIDDGGSVLDRVYIQNAARQIVDQGHWDNLKFWGHNGLAKLRTSGGVDYVPKLYDLSGTGIDLLQTVDGRQPKWVSNGIEFDGSDDRLHVTGNATIAAITELTLTCWMYIRPVVSTAVPGFLGSENGHIGSVKLTVDSVDIVRLNGRNSSGGNVVSDDTAYTANTWNHIVVARKTGEDHRFYFNNAELTNNSPNENQTIQTLNGDLAIGCRHNTTSFDLFCDDTLNDIRIYDTALSATEISDIYNQTKSYYGIS